VTPEQAFDMHHQAVFRFVYRLTRRTDLAEDITQECFLAFVRAPGRFDETRGSIKTYLFGIARNLVLKDYRDRPDDAPLEGGEHDRAEERLSADLAAAVEQAVAALPGLQQEALVLFEYEGFTLEEIAEVAGADVGTIKSRLYRARERLKRTLAPRGKGRAYGTA
jgi:RNA polymerase sigma-70 factor (ECF subfamily)